MSTVTAVKKGNMICLACDSLTTYGSTKLPGHYHGTAQKIFQWGESYIGVVGSVAIEAVLLDIIPEYPDVDFSSRTSIYKFFKQLHPRLKDDYFLKPSEGDDDPVESSQIEMVIANKHGIFGLFSYREVFEYTRFWAFGSGRNYALGAMKTAYDMHDFDAAKVAQLGVEAGVEFDDASGGETQKIIIYTQA